MGIGDLRTPPSGQGSPNGPHYPSWGSVTRRVEVRLDSLDAGATHYPSWGSVTVHRNGLVVTDLLLITPHGDR